MRRRPTAALLLVCALAGPSLAWAQSDPSATDIDTARTAFQQALELRDKRHDLRGAIEKLKAAYALVPTPRIGLELGKTYQQSGQLVEARAAYLDVDRLPQTMVVQGMKRPESPEAKKARDDCRAAASDLDSRIPSIVIRTQADGQVTVDGINVPSDSLTVPRRMNPGRHVVALMGEGGVVGSRKVVDLKEGSDTTTVELATTPTARVNNTDQDDGDAGPSNRFTPPPLARTENPTRNAVRTWSLVLAGVGVASDLIAFYVTENAIKDHCDSTTKVCAGLGSKTTAYGFAIAGDVLLGAGVITFVVSMLMPKYGAPPSQVGFTPTPGGGFLTAQGRF